MQDNNQNMRNSIAGDSFASVEDIIREKIHAKSRELEREIFEDDYIHFQKPVERPFIKSERPYTTILIGGLTWKHESLVKAALENLGYKIAILPTPDVKAFQIGKEYGNNGQCNPTYFTVGNLVKYLQQLEDSGMSREDIVDKHVFFTAGACGPCRFGMYEAEYRLALRNSGFEEFRVLLFQQSGGLNQSDVEAGLEMNEDLFLGILNALNMGDLINAAAYQIRPYEVNPGDTDRAMKESMEFLHNVMRSKSAAKSAGPNGFLRFMPGIGGNSDKIEKFREQLFGKTLVDAFRQVRERLDSIKVDRTRVKPTVKITGEFWAQTTEGDGNFNMFSFLEKEGAEVLVEPIATWITYMIHQYKQKLRDRKEIPEKEEAPAWWNLPARASLLKKYYFKIAKITLAEKLFVREFERLRCALGGTTHELIDQYELQRAGHPYYNSRSGGGEGHLEIAKNIYYSHKNMAHMVLSLKPFGCMPSTQSDGAQAAVVSHFKDMLYLPVETSGEGEINAHSRVQMTLGEARFKARDEFEKVLNGTGFTLDQIHDYIAGRPELSRAMYPVPHVKGIVGTGAAYVHHVAGLMRREGGVN